MKKIQYTQDGYQKLVKEKEQLELERVEAVKNLSIARDMGDRSENAAYKYARQKLSGIDRQLRFLNYQLKYAHIITPRSDGFIDIGSSVEVDDGISKRTFIIVGGYESDISSGRISTFSPIGKTLMGKKEGDKVLIEVPAGSVTYRILKVS